MEMTEPLGFAPVPMQIRFVPVQNSNGEGAVQMTVRTQAGETVVFIPPEAFEQVFLPGLAAAQHLLGKPKLIVPAVRIDSNILKNIQSGR